jgi:hypothetical protein
VGLTLEMWPFGQPKFVVEVEDDGIEGAEWTVRILMRAIDNFTIADWAFLLNESVVASPENGHLRSSGSIPKENRFDFGRGGVTRLWLFQLLQ